jgi:hypothetical protein
MPWTASSRSPVAPVPVMVEVAFSDFGGLAPEDGQVTAGVLFADAVVPDTVDLSVGATFYYDLAAEESSWGAGAKAGVSLVDFPRSALRSMATRMTL